MARRGAARPRHRLSTVIIYTVAIDGTPYLLTRRDDEQPSRVGDIVTPDGTDWEVVIDHADDEGVQLVGTRIDG